MRTISWNTFSLRDYWYLALRRKWVLLLPPILMMVAAGLYAMYSPPIYRAETTLIASRVERGDALRGLSSMPIPGQQSFELIRHKIMSRPILNQVAAHESIALKKRLEERLYAQPKGKVARARRFLGDAWSRVRESLHFGISRDVEPTEEDIDEMIVEYLRSIISLSDRKGLITIRVEHTEPQLATNIANQVAAAYTQTVSQGRVKQAKGSYAVITEQLKKYRGQLHDSEEALRKARESGLLKSVNSENIELIDKTTEAEAQLIKLEFDISDKQKQINDLEMQSGTNALITSPEIRILRDDLRNARTRLADLQSRYSDTWSEVRQAKERVVTLEVQLETAETSAREATRAQIFPTVKQYEAELRQLQLDKLEITRKRNQYRQAMDQLPAEQSRLTSLIREKQQNEKIYDFLLQRIHEAEILSATELAKEDDVTEVIDEAILPRKPVRPDKLKIILLGIVMGCGGGFALALTLEYFDHSIRSIEDVENFFEGIPVLGVIPKLE